MNFVILYEGGYMGSNVLVHLYLLNKWCVKWSKQTLAKDWLTIGGFTDCGGWCGGEWWWGVEIEQSISSEFIGCKGRKRYTKEFVTSSDDPPFLSFPPLSSNT